MEIIISFAILLVGGWLCGKIADKIFLPPLIGMIIFGCLANVYFGWIDPKAIEFGKYLKNMALVVVLLIGGIGIKKEQIKKVGRPAILLSMLPATMEGFAVAFISMKLFGFTFVQGGILGFIVAAVSPAVLIPSMVDLIRRRLGEKKAIPQMLLTGASADDSFAIAFFTSFIGLYFGKANEFAMNLVKIPIGVAVGILLGAGFAVVLGNICRKIKSHHVLEVLLIVVVAIAMRLVEEHYHLSYFNSLIGVMAMGYTITNYFPDVTVRIIDNLKKFWKVGAIFLFTLVGTAINPTLAGELFLTGLGVVTVSLTVRSIGVWISLLGTDLNLKERLFCVIAYLPKATIQSAKAGIPLSMGVAGGEIIQAISILAVLITAPIGAIGIKLSAPRFLEEAVD